MRLGVADENKQLKRWLRGLREQAELSQSDVAELLGVSLKTVNNMENPREGFPNGLTMLRYLRALGVVDSPAQAPGFGRLATLEEAVRESVALTKEALQLLRESQRRETANPRAQPRAKTS